MGEDNYILAWSDDFETQGQIDRKKWKFDVGGGCWGNGELQCYTDNANNIFIKDKVLHIRAYKENYQNFEYTSARIVSRESWKYGKIQIRAKLPLERGTWPAIWMLPDDFNGDNWPQCGEIDIVEHVAHMFGKVHFSLHSFKYNWMKENRYNRIIDIGNAVTEFNTYELEWDKNGFKLFINEEEVIKISKDQEEDESAWPFDKRYHLIMNVAVGGWGGWNGIGGDWPQDLEIDYIRVYQNVI